MFLGDKQNAFEEELSSRGIDPEVFYYQIRMNEREGGVSERFSFAQDEDFVDFLLEIAFDPNRAREVREQLSTFRRELVERNEQLKPELEYCRGLIVRLGKVAGVTRDRSDVFHDVEAQRRRLEGLSRWVTERLGTLTSETNRLDGAMRDAQAGADESAAERIKQELESLAAQLSEQEDLIQSKKGGRNALAAQAERVERSLRDFEKELAELECASAAGPVESLRADYRTLRADYEGKVNADALSQMAALMHQEADGAQQEFERVLGQFDGIDASEVDTEIRRGQAVDQVRRLLFPH